MRALTLGLALVAVLPTGCGGRREAGDTRATTTNDPWGRSPPIEFVTAGDQTDIPPGRFAVVVHNETEALARLAASPWVGVSPAEAEAYTGRTFDGPGGELVLLRALALNEATGAFSVTWRAGEVRVHHGCLGRSPLPQTRRAVVARLPGPPTEVYVDCGMAE